MLLGLKIVREAPSKISQPEKYKGLQRQDKERIFDDRPSADRFIPPISLLYDGFGIFEEVRKERSVPGDDHILGSPLWIKVNEFADEMADFYDSEAARRVVVTHYLQEIFNARDDPKSIQA